VRFRAPVILPPNAMGESIRSSATTSTKTGGQMTTRRVAPLELAELIAAKTGVSIDVVKRILTAQAEITYEQADRGVMIPGIGLLSVAVRPGREVTMQFGAKKGQTIAIPASRKVSLRISKFAVDRILAAPEPLPDLFVPPPEANFKYLLTRRSCPTRRSSRASFRSARWKTRRRRRRSAHFVCRISRSPAVESSRPI
jgi:hypothetical protein